MQERVPMSAPDITEDDVEVVANVVRSGRLALGPKTEEFERLIAEYTGTDHAVAVSSGTAALHLIVKSLGIGPGDEVLVPSFTFIASVNAILYEGAKPVFVDIEPDTYNLDPEDLEQKITPLTKAIMAVDVFGHPADWDALMRISMDYDLRVIDDSCEALGARYNDKSLGQFGDAAAFAFYPNKQITTGEGGMIVTNNPNIAKICRSLRNQGRGEMGSWLEHERLGYNYRMTEMSAALGISQLRRLEDILAKRERVARMYTSRLSGLEWVRTPAVRPNVRKSWFVYTITLSEGLSRDAVMQAMMREGIPSRGYFSPVHLQGYIRELLGTHEGMLPVTESVAGRTMALPFHSNLSEDEVDEVVEVLSRCVRSLLKA
ncbi:MAG: DegT/DnrJ/EryC1/StrS family aminotransferase [Methanothrix sp.]|uniref:DegT/DnrJ/EryC1/StrS family aminotransferase n=1 Tax=Methanothrix sp. TaxID=90426 RepID=UPI00247BCC89|nr:DegT/DnrJ/EryC1/StrS family aminotransferase [Methanothrix sp.]